MFEREPNQGFIKLAGIDVASVPLPLLRRSIAIVPQDPTLFSGSIRSNLDPFDEWTVEQLVAALSSVGIDERVDAPVTDGGSNFSVGQRQLVRSYSPKAAAARPLIECLSMVV